MIKNNLSKDIEYDRFSKSRLDMALRIQKQCVDTMKAASAVNYMQALNQRHEQVSLADCLTNRRVQDPHPHPIQERTDEV